MDHIKGITQRREEGKAIFQSQGCAANAWEFECGAPEMLTVSSDFCGRINMRFGTSCLSIRRWITFGESNLFLLFRNF